MTKRLMQLAYCLLLAGLMLASCNKEENLEFSPETTVFEESVSFIGLKNDLKPKVLNLPERQTTIAEPNEILVQPDPSLLSFRESTVTRPRKVRQSSSEPAFLSSDIELTGRNTEIDVAVCVNSQTGETTICNDDVFYARLGMKTNLNGNEKTFYLTVDEEKVYTFYLTNTTENLAMMLFKAAEIVVGDPVPENNQTFRVVMERYRKLVAYGSSFSGVSEHNGPERLTKGQNILVVDSATGKGGSFNLKAVSKDVEVGCSNFFGTKLMADDFNTYKPGGVAQQTDLWENWTFSHFDGEVVIDQEEPSEQYLKIVRMNGDFEEHGALLRTGERRDGRFHMRFDLNVKKGKAAYFNLQKFISENPDENEWGPEFFFVGDSRLAGNAPNDNFGLALIRTTNNSQLRALRFPTDTWMRLLLDFDFNNDQLLLFINNFSQPLFSWNISDINELQRNPAQQQVGRNQLEGLVFFGADVSLSDVNNQLIDTWDSEFLIDNFCLSQVSE